MILDKLTQQLPDMVKDDIAAFLVENQNYLARMWHLRCILLSSPYRGIFRNLVYFYNGRAGNISQTEDILDRVLNFITNYTHPSWTARK